jgi:hypothetical protein
MVLILLVLLLALLLGGLGFAVHILWWIALIVLVVWVLGFLVRVGEGGSRGRWYRWLPVRRALLATRRLDLTNSGRLRSDARYCHCPRAPGTMCE